VAAKSFQQEVAEELAGKAVMWGPAVAGGLALGPVGGAAGGNSLSRHRGFRQFPLWPERGPKQTGVEGAC
jgi:hypothetical protein